MTIKLGTRPSELAMYQANLVKDALRNVFPDLDIEIIPISTRGDTDRDTPLNKLGQTGIFTKTIDQAVFDNRVDAGIHSLKDYPSTMPPGLKLLAVLPRDGFWDLFVPGHNFDGNYDRSMTILSGSPRRRAQWASKYRNHNFAELRGNMDTRLKKMTNGDGGIVSKQGLERIGLTPDNAVTLDWMTPAPAQGVVAVIGSEDNDELARIFEKINHEETFIASHIERGFMAEMEGGCSLPLGALATVNEKEIHFEGRIDKLDGSETVKIEKTFSKGSWKYISKQLSSQLKQQGGQRIYDSIRAQRPKDVLCAREVDSNQRELGFQNGIKLHDIKVLEVKHLDFEISPEGPVVISSANAVRALASKLGALHNMAYVVGNKTKALLEDLGYQGKIQWASNMEALLEHIDPDVERLVYYCAEETTGKLENSVLGERVVRIPVYRTENIKPRLARLHWDAIAVFSPKGLYNICEHNDFDKKIRIVAIGPTTAEAARKEGFTYVMESDEPTVESVVYKLSKVLNDQE